jgi:hypothetical protein
MSGIKRHLILEPPRLLWGTNFGFLSDSHKASVAGLLDSEV